MNFYLDGERERESEPAPKQPTSDTGRPSLPDPGEYKDRSLPDPSDYRPLEGERPDFPVRRRGRD